MTGEERSLKTDKTGLPADLILVALLIGVAFVFFTKFLCLPVSYDESGFLWEGWNVLRHEVPYVDFTDHKPLMIMFMNALAIACFGLQHARWLPFVIACLTAIVFFFSMRRLRIQRTYALVIALTFVYFFFNNAFHNGTLDESETYGFAFSVLAFAFLHWNVWDTGKAAYAMKFLGGMFAALAVSSKEPFLLVVVPLIVATYVFEAPLQGQHRNKRFLAVLLGGGAVVLCTIGYLLLNGALIEYVKIIQKNLIYSKYYAQDVGWYVYTSFWGSVGYDLGKLFDGYSGGLFFLPLVPFYVIFVWRWKGSALTIIHLVGIALACYAVSLAHCFLNHYYLIGLIAFIQPAVYGAFSTGADLKRTSRQFAVLLPAAVVSLSALQILPAIKTDMGCPSGSVDYSVPDDLKSAVEKYSSENDYILLTKNPIYYVLLNRKHTYGWAYMVDEYIRMYDGATEEDRLQRLKMDMEAKLPKVIYLGRGSLISRQKKHLDQVILPLIQEHHYTRLSPGLFVLPPAENREL